MKLQPESNDNTMEDTDERRDERKTVPELELNRKQRRRFAKRHGLFQDKSGEAWRIGNKHMKGQKQTSTQEHRLGE